MGRELESQVGIIGINGIQQQQLSQPEMGKPVKVSGIRLFAQPSMADNA